MTSPTLLGPDLLAVPPIDATFDNEVGQIAITVYLTLALTLFVWGMKQPQKRLIIAATLFGGAITSTIEPLLDVVTGALHPIVGQHAMFTLMGRSIPLWVLVCYAIYYGGFGSLNLIAFIKGVSRRGVCLWFLAPLLGDVLWEEVMLYYKL